MRGDAAAAPAGLFVDEGGAPRCGVAALVAAAAAVDVVAAGVAVGVLLPCASPVPSVSAARRSARTCCNLAFSASWRSLLRRRENQDWGDEGGGGRVKRGKGMGV